MFETVNFFVSSEILSDSVADKLDGFGPKFCGLYNKHALKTHLDFDDDEDEEEYGGNQSKNQIHEQGSESGKDRVIDSDNDFELDRAEMRSWQPSYKLKSYTVIIFSKVEYFPISNIKQKIIALKNCRKKGIV